MSREIKFRAWVKEVYEDGEFAYGGYMVQSSVIARLVLRSTTNLMLGGTGTGIDYFEQGKLLPGLGSVERLRSDEIELMQYTGLRDKNGVEIYEGDVCRVINPNGDEDKACHVDFDSISSCYTYSPEDGYGDYDISSIGWAMQLGFQFEVIGNIYENADLLETAGESK